MIVALIFILEVLSGNNLARGRPTLQSSTSYDGLASRAVDGKSDPMYYRGHTCTCTDYEAKPWWRVDLGKEDTVASVKITNRGDCCGKRLRNFDILVGNADRNPDANALYVFCRVVTIIFVASKSIFQEGHFYGRKYQLDLTHGDDAQLPRV